MYVVFKSSSFIIKQQKVFLLWILYIKNSSPVLEDSGKLTKWHYELRVQSEQWEGEGLKSNCLKLFVLLLTSV